MKKILAILIALMLAFSFVACNDENPPEDTPGTQETPGTEENPLEEGWQGPIVPIPPIE